MEKEERERGVIYSLGLYILVYSSLSMCYFWSTILLNLNLRCCGQLEAISLWLFFIIISTSCYLSHVDLRHSLPVSDIIKSRSISRWHSTFPFNHVHEEQRPCHSIQIHENTISRPTNQTSYKFCRHFSSSSV